MYVCMVSFEEKSTLVYDQVIFEYVNVVRHMDSTEIADLNPSALKLLWPLLGNWSWLIIPSMLFTCHWPIQVPRFIIV